MRTGCMAAFVANERVASIAVAPDQPVLAALRVWPAPRPLALDLLFVRKKRLHPLLEGAHHASREDRNGGEEGEDLLLLQLDFLAVGKLPRHADEAALL